MTINKPVDWTSGQWIALFCFSVGGLLSWLAFVLSRADHDMKLLALGSVISTSSGLVTTGATILVGKTPPASQTTKDLPPGSVTNDSSTTLIPPIDPNSIPKS